MIISDVYIEALGTYLADHADIRTAVEAGLYDEETRVESGLEGTYTAGDTPAVDMAAMAGRHALDRAGAEPGSVDYVIHGGTYYQGPPGWSATGYIMGKLGIEEVPSLQINQECNSMLAGLEVAVGALTGVSGRETVLMTMAANYSTPLVDRWRGAGPQAVFSDGGAAMLLSSSGGFAELLSLNAGTLTSAEGWLRGSGALRPPREGDNWRLDPVQSAIDHAGRSGQSIQDWLEAAGEQCRQLCEQSMSEAKIEKEDLKKVVVFHLARYSIEESVARLIGVPLERTSWDVGRAIGHIGPADHIISLDRLLRAGELREGDHALLVSWGGGWNTSAAVIRILSVPEWARPSD